MKIVSRDRFFRVMNYRTSRSRSL